MYDIRQYIHNVPIRYTFRCLYRKLLTDPSHKTLSMLKINLEVIIFVQYTFILKNVSKFVIIKCNFKT